jgi:hypothetical protein
MRYHTKPSKQTYFLAFAARVCTGVLGNTVQVGHQTVEKALRHMAQTLLLAGYDDPRRTYGAKELDLPFRHLLKSYKNKDPAPQPQLAIPLATHRACGSLPSSIKLRPRSGHRRSHCNCLLLFTLSGRVYNAQVKHPNAHRPILIARCHVSMDGRFGHPKHELVR